MNGGIYIHIPFCKVKCIYCDFYSITKRESEISLFTEKLIKEIDLYADKYPTQWQINSIFFGGGTPSLMPSNDINQILEKLYSKFNFSKNIEISLETNPGEAPLNRLREYYNIGVNRLSIGFQSFQPNLLKFMGRLHLPEDSYKTYANARKAGFTNINADLIFDIPGQTLDIWKKDLEELVKLSPEHISAYSLTVEKQTALFKLVQSGKIKLPEESIDIAMFLHTRKYLKKKKYISYEISNFSKNNNFQCQHNLHYWNLNPYLAFGPSAHGYDLKKRWWNVRSIDSYYNSIDKKILPIEGKEIITKTNNINELIFNGLRLSRGIPMLKLKNLLNKEFDSFIKNSLNKWKELKIKDQHLMLDEEGTLIADEICSDLFLE